MHPFLNTAVKAARSAGKHITRAIDHGIELKVHEKGLNDLVTNLDIAIEDEITETLLRAYPDHAVLGEEQGRKGAANAQHLWIIDPLDGTLNYVHGIPKFAIAIALKIFGQVEYACIYDPIAQEIFTAAKGAGAQLNERRLRVSELPNLRGAMIGASLGDRGPMKIDQALASMKSLVEEGASIRRFGTATLSLAYVAAGRLDAYWDTGLKEWDMAAGALLIKEAGGFVSDLQGGPDYLARGEILAGSRRVYSALAKNLQAHDIGL